MYTGSDRLSGHAYAPGFEPDFVTKLIERTGEDWLVALAVVVVSCCVLTCILVPGQMATRSRRRRRKLEERKYLTAEQLAEKLREDGVIR